MARFACNQAPDADMAKLIQKVRIDASRLDPLLNNAVAVYPELTGEDPFWNNRFKAL